MGIRLRGLTFWFVASAQCAKLEYSPARIQQLVQSGEASWAGAQWAACWNGGLNCQTFLWKKSVDRHLFFVLRNGKSHGEFREEIMFERRFLRIIENYLVASARNAPSLVDGERPFVRREETLLRQNGEWVASDLRWSFVWCSENGDNLRTEAALSERILKRNVTLRVNSHLTSQNVEYYVKAFRPEATKYEKAFGDKVLGDRYLLTQSKLSDGICNFRVEWAESRPALLFELHERIPNPINDANPLMLRTKVVASMTVKNDSLRGENPHFDFH
jgi:hypothetical protein